MKITIIIVMICLIGFSFSLCCKELCFKCKGNGKYLVLCFNCNGKGFINIRNKIQSGHICSKCKGKGKILINCNCGVKND